jgi:antitoxin (DNA-binding transcriptional repressor) of toxin-antitoxin stability system
VNAYVDSSVALRIVLGEFHALTSWPRIERSVSSELVRVERLRTVDRHVRDRQPSRKKCATLCAMSERDAGRRRVGVRELRQNLSVYLRDVKAGESLDVTERGHVVARLAPPPSPDETILERLAREGKLTPATGSIAALPPPVSLAPGETPLTDVLRQLRDEEPW